MEFKVPPPSSVASTDGQILTENNYLINLNNHLGNMQDFTKTIKSENKNFLIKEEPTHIRVKEEFLMPLDEFDNVFVKEELSDILYDELEKFINAGVSVPYEEFEKFASTAYVEEELLIPYDVFEDNFTSEQNLSNLESSELQNQQSVMQECFVNLPKLPVNFETYSLRELETSMLQVLSKSEHSNKTKYSRKYKKPLQTNFAGDNVRNVGTAKRYKRCYYPDKRPLTCNMCDYKTPYKYLLTRHKKIHKGKNPYVCLMCDFRSAKKEDYIVHQSIHKGSKPFTCNLCDFRASRKTYVTKHKFLHYRKENLLTCATCHYKTPFKENLKRHMLIHSIHKPFVCNVCGFKTAHKVVIKSHSRIHSGEKPFACKLCTYTTAHHSSLGKHKKIHIGTKSFTCNICNYKAMFKEHLKRHFRTHSGEKPFVCETCDFTTAHKESLKVHQYIHNKEELACNICEFTTTHSTNMQRHITRMHKSLSQKVKKS